MSQTRWSGLPRCDRETFACLPMERWAHAADALEGLISSGAVDKALGLGWDALELVGVRRRSPHDAPSQAGLIFSMKAGDSVSRVGRAGCVISYANVRHIWKRVPLPSDGSLVLPWDLGGATPLPKLTSGRPDDDIV